MSFCADLLARSAMSEEFALLGFPLPVLDNPVRADGAGAVGATGAHINGYADRRNVVIYDDSVSGLNLAIHFAGFRNTLVLGRGCNLRNGSVITLEGDDGIAMVCGGPGQSKVNMTLRQSGPLAYYGPGCTANQIDMLAHGAMAAIGPDSLMSWGITIRTYDSHAIFDLASLEQINQPKNTVLGHHTWVAQDCIIMPGVTVGSGSIVGADSVVTRSIPPQSLAVGSPAKVIREGVSWARDPHPTRETMARVAEFLTAKTPRVGATRDE